MDFKTYQEEKWTSAKNFEIYYEVSDLGRVRRLPRKSRNSRNPHTFKSYDYKILSLNSKNTDRYITCKLTINGITRSVQLHRLVLESFIPMSKTRNIVNHLDGNKHNNKLENLEWVTAKENVNHTIKNGRAKYSFGENSGKTVLSNRDVIKIKFLLKNKKLKQREIASIFNTSVKIITDINTERTWSHIYDNIIKAIT